MLRGDEVDAPVADIIDVAREQRVHLLLAWALQRSGRELGTLVADVRREALIDELRVRELGRVMAALEDAGASPVAFKGAALAHTHYPESWVRTRLDSDLLVDAGKRPEAFERLKTLGYWRPAFISGELVMHQAPYIRTDDAGVEHVLDVHWRIANPQLIAAVLSHREIRDEARTIDARGRPFRVPSDVHSLLLACLHRAAHHNDDEDLLWLYDIHLLSEALDVDAWSRFVTLASQRRVRTICARGLALSIARFKTVVPQDVMSALAPQESKQREASAVYLKKDLRQIDRLASDLRALGPLGGARLVREHLFPPAAYMQEMYGVQSRALLPAFYMRRIVAGVSKWLRPGGPNG